MTEKNKQKSGKNLLEVKNLTVSFQSGGKLLPAVTDLSFHLKEGEILALVGESGCGKSISCMALSRLLPEQRKLLSCLQELAKRNITYLKALYFVENNNCFRQNSCEEIKICSPCDTLRELYRSMTEGIEKYGNAREEWAKNKRTQQKYILCILQSLL